MNTNLDISDIYWNMYLGNTQEGMLPSTIYYVKNNL